MLPLEFWHCLHLNDDKILFIKSEDLFFKPDTYNNICSFLNHSLLSDKKINHIIKKPVNKQKHSFYPKWKDWSEDEKDLLINITPLGKKYGYW